MPQFVSKRHKEILKILRTHYDASNIEGWPTQEANVGHMSGMTNANLRLDALIWVDCTKAVAIEVQSEIHLGKQIYNSDYNKIKGMDELKKDMLSKLGIPLIEIMPDDSIDILSLSARIDIASINSQHFIDHRGKIPKQKKPFMQRATEWKSSKFDKQDSKLPSSSFRKKA